MISFLRLSYSALHSPLMNTVSTFLLGGLFLISSNIVVEKDAISTKTAPSTIPGQSEIHKLQIEIIQNNNK